MISAYAAVPFRLVFGLSCCIQIGLLTCAMSSRQQCGCQFCQKPDLGGYHSQWFTPEEDLTTGESILFLIWRVSNKHMWHCPQSCIGTSPSIHTCKSHYVQVRQNFSPVREGNCLRCLKEMTPEIQSQPNAKEANAWRMFQKYMLSLLPWLQQTFGIFSQNPKSAFRWQRLPCC